MLLLEPYLRESLSCRPPNYHIPVTNNPIYLDPIIVQEDMPTLSQGLIQVPNEISDHCATYVHIPFEYPLHDTFTRNVWIYKDANNELFNKKYLILIVHVFIKVLSMKQINYLQIFFFFLIFIFQETCNRQNIYLHIQTFSYILSTYWSYIYIHISLVVLIS